MSFSHQQTQPNSTDHQDPDTNPDIQIQIHKRTPKLSINRKSPSPPHLESSIPISLKEDFAHLSIKALTTAQNLNDIQRQLTNSYRVVFPNDVVSLRRIRATFVADSNPADPTLAPAPKIPIEGIRLRPSKPAYDEWAHQMEDQRSGFEYEDLDDFKTLILDIEGRCSRDRRVRENVRTELKSTLAQFMAMHDEMLALVTAEKFVPSYARVLGNVWRLVLVGVDGAEGVAWKEFLELGI